MASDPDAGRDDVETKTQTAGVVGANSPTVATVAVVGGGARDEHPDSLHFAPGTVVGRYLIIEQIGKGGMGVVYKAHDPKLDRMVAVKMMPASDLGGAPEVVERLLREAQALAKLQHPNVIAVHDAGTAAGAVFVATELVAGETLRPWMVRVHPWREIVAVFVAAGEGLWAAHRAGIVHRDFKPENVMISSDGRVRVLDFGLARSAESPASATDTPSAELRLSGPCADWLTHTPPNLLATPVTRIGAVLGTPRYMGLERFLGKSASLASDQFAFCVSLYEALYRQRPFAADTVELLREQLAAGAIVRPPRDTPVPARVLQVLRRGLAPRPEDRYPSMGVLLAALQHDPWASRRRRLPLAAATLAMIVAVAVIATRRGAAPSRLCTGAPAEMTGVWDQQRRGVVQLAFARTDLPYKDRTFQSVARGLDGYRDAWISMRTSACRATQVTGAQSAALLDLRMQCLDRRREYLRQLIGVLEDADETVVGRAAQAVQNLPTVEGCADVLALTARTALPSDPALRARVETAQDGHAEMSALYAAGKYDDAMPLAGPLLVEATAIGYHPLIAEIQLLQGGLYDRTGRFAEARRAYWLAIAEADMGRSDEVRAEALLQIAWVVGERLGRPGEAREHAEHAFAAIDRLDQQDRHLAKYQRVLGILDVREGHYQGALEHATLALELARRGFGEDHWYFATVLNDLAIASYMLRQHDRAISYGEQALVLWQRTFGSVHPDVAAAQINLGEFRAAQGRYDDAIPHYQQAISIGRQLTGYEVGDVIISLADAYRHLGRLAEARQLIEATVAEWTTKYDADNVRFAYPSLVLGRLALAEGQAAAAVPLLERAAELRERDGGDPYDLAEARFQLARALRAAGRAPARARQLAEQAQAGFVLATARGAEILPEVSAFLAADR